MALITFIVPVKGRLEQVKQTLPKLAEIATSQTILVDWSCQEETGKWVRENLPSVKVIEVKDQKYFHLAKARNVGALEVLSPYVCFIDCDMLISADFYPALQAALGPDNMVLFESWRKKGGIHGYAGFIACSTYSYLRVSGYNEELSGYGYDDGDFMDRLERLGLKRTYIPNETAVHLEHDHLSRVVNYANRNTSETYTVNMAHSQAALAKADFRPLLPPFAYRSIFEQFRGQSVLLAEPPGNIGDLLIRAGCYDLLRHYEIKYTVADPKAIRAVQPAAVNEKRILYTGGGNMGCFYEVPWALRRILRTWNIPITILPQSYYGEEEVEYDQVWVREHASRKYYAASKLGPDLAFAYFPQKAFEQSKPKFKTGLFLREDAESKGFNHKHSIGDPTLLCKTVDDYVWLAANYEHIVTDRLHFAIAGLMLKRRVTLLPNSYFKNWSMFQSWLCFMGCEWADSL